MFNRWINRFRYNGLWEWGFWQMVSVRDFSDSFPKEDSMLHRMPCISLSSSKLFIVITLSFQKDRSNWSTQEMTIRTVSGRSLGRKRRLSRIFDISNWSMESISMKILFPVSFACWSKVRMLFSKRVSNSLNPDSSKSLSVGAISSSLLSLDKNSVCLCDSEDVVSARIWLVCSSMKAIICFISPPAWLVMGV